MAAILPELPVLLDLLGLGLTLWLGLNLFAHAWGWQRGSARLAAIALWALAIFFALSLYNHAITPLAGASVRKSYLRLLLLPLPLGWLLLVRQLGPGVLLSRSRLGTMGLLLLTLATLAVGLFWGPLNPEQLALSWRFLPAYLLTLLFGMGFAAVVAARGRMITMGTLERRVLAFMFLATLPLAVGAGLQTMEWVFGLGHPIATRFLGQNVEQLRIVARGGMLFSSALLVLALLTAARADGATHISHFRHSLLVTAVMAVLYLGVGAWVVSYWQLPEEVLGIFLLLALLTDWLDNATRARLEQLLYRGQTGRLRRQLRTVADDLENPTALPPALRPLLSRLARQINSPQLGLALKEGDEYRIRLALRPSWEGEVIKVPNPSVWEERSMGGWNHPVKSPAGQVIGIIASEQTGPLGPIQVRALEDAAREIAVLLEEYSALEQRREALERALGEYDEFATRLDSRYAHYAAPPRKQLDLRRDVRRVFEHWDDANYIGKQRLANLNVITENLAPGQKSQQGRARLLMEMLESLVEQLRPFEGEPLSPPSAEWLPFLVLREQYIGRRKPAEVAEELEIGRLAMRRAAARGMEMVARSMAELEGARKPEETPRKRPTTPSRTPSTRPTPTRPSTGFGSTPTSPPYGAAPTPATQGTGRRNPIQGLSNRFRRRQGGTQPEQQPPPTQRPAIPSASQPLGGTPALGASQGPTRPFTPSTSNPATGAAPASSQSGGIRSLRERFGNQPPPSTGTPSQGTPGFSSAQPSRPPQGAGSGAPPPAPPPTTQPGYTPPQGGTPSQRRVFSPQDQPPGGAPAPGPGIPGSVSPQGQNAPQRRRFTRPVPKPSEREDSEQKPPERPDSDYETPIP